jgi:Flp pilus assembly protein TadG
MNVKLGRTVAGMMGQALMEFAIASGVLALMLGGTIEFGFMLGHKVDLDNAARAGARYAADNSLNNPGIWSTATPAPTTSIEGQVQNSGGTADVPNDDNHISIAYYDPTSGTNILCGQYHASSNAMVYVNGYTATTCLARGNLVVVKVTNSYSLFTRIITVAPSLTSIATFGVMN